MLANGMIVNCVCQLDRVAGFPDIWSNIILNMSAGAGGPFLDEVISVDSVDSVKQIVVLVVGLSQSVEDLNRTKGLRDSKLYLPAC